MLRLRPWIRGFAVLSALLYSTEAYALGPRADPWWAHDKALHFEASTIITAGSYGLTALATERRWVRLLVATVIGVAAGVGKEFYDEHRGSSASFRDLTWDGLGVGAGLTISLILDQ